MRGRCQCCCLRDRHRIADHDVLGIGSGTDLDHTGRRRGGQRSRCVPQHQISVFVFEERNPKAHEYDAECTEPVEIGKFKVGCSLRTSPKAMSLHPRTIFPV